MVYLDNAATSFPKPREVVKEVVKCLEKYCGNPGRSGHELSLLAAEKIYSTRELLAEHLNIAEPERIVFTHNATYALNLAIKTTIKEKCHIITSDLEHNSVLRPLYALCDRLGCELSFFDSDLPTEEAIKPLIRADTGYIVSTICSNVTGKKISLEELSRISSKYGLGLIVDASQYIGHFPIDLSGKKITLCAPGHKALFGIQGSGFAVFLDDLRRESYIEGGSGGDSFNRKMPENLPERFEAGTLSTPAIASLFAGLEYIKSVSLDAIEERIKGLTELLQNALDIKDVTVYGCENGICSFNFSGYKSEQIASLLNRKGIAVRGGFHCAPVCHTKLGTETTGAVRISLSYLNRESDIAHLKRALLDLRLGV